MIVRYIVLVMVCGWISNANSQYGFHGRKNAFGIGIGTNQPIIINNNGPYGLRLEKSLLLPKLSLEFLHENRKGNAFFLQADFQTLPNAETTFKSVTGFTYHQVTTYDTIRSRSNSIRLSTGVKKYSSIGILGGYWGLRGSGSVTFNKSIHSKTVTDIETDYNTKLVKRSSKQESGVSFIPGIGILFGKTIPIGDRSLVDFGFELNLTLGRFSAYQGVPNSVINSTLNNKIINSKQLLTTNGVGVFVKIYLL